ncbi:unnamed protein product, partial [Ectocarpus sp. 12 AP-2014]
GFASVFGILDSQNDVVVKGAFKSIEVRNVKLLWQHDASKPIGLIKSLSEDEYGLKFEAEINNNIEAGREASELIKQKAICGLSIGFSINSSSYNEKGMRVISDLNLAEISVVTFPANHQAEIIYSFLSRESKKSEKINKLEEKLNKMQNYI